MCSRCHSKFFPYTNLSTPYNNPMKKVLSFIPLYRQVKSNLLKPQSWQMAELDFTSDCGHNHGTNLSLQPGCLAPVAASPTNLLLVVWLPLWLSSRFRTDQPVQSSKNVEPPACLCAVEMGKVTLHALFSFMQKYPVDKPVKGSTV